MNRLEIIEKVGFEIALLHPKWDNKKIQKYWGAELAADIREKYEMEDYELVSLIAELYVPMLNDENRPSRRIKI